MNKILLASAMMLLTCQVSIGQNTGNEIKEVKSDVTAIKAKQSSMQNTITSNCKDIKFLTSQRKLLLEEIDSLNGNISILKDSLFTVSSQLKHDINQTNNIVSENEAQLSSSIKTKSVIGIVVLAFITIFGFIISLFLRNKVEHHNSAIEDIKKLQLQLRAAQQKLEEESILLDNKLVELLEKKIDTTSKDIIIDHSLVLKVADEITRIELNLSRMDPSIKGYKQLTKGVERIKNNFLAKGYEIADMLGKPYNEGMRINADFVLDESLKPGTRLITSIIKPQVTFNGEMIQKAIVTVTQNV